MAYVISSVMAFYSMSYVEIMKLPMKVFWALSQNIERMQAEDELRMASAISGALGGNKDYFNRLRGVIGNVVSVENLFDKTAMQRLKAKIK